MVLMMFIMGELRHDARHEYQHICVSYFRAFRVKIYQFVVGTNCEHYVLNVGSAAGTCETDEAFCEKHTLFNRFHGTLRTFSPDEDTCCIFGL